MDNPLLLLEKCALCPRECGVNRLIGEKGFCGIGNEIIIAHYGAHFGEETPISGTRGSGTIFFASCNLRCIYCQNYQISHGGSGESVTVQGLVEIFFQLKQQGCHNINLVSPVPYIPFIALAIEQAIKEGIEIPFIYNTNAYEHVHALRALDGLIDIYLPDFKYWSAYIAEKFSHVPRDKSYPEHAKWAISEMKRQVGDLVIEDGVAKKGILIRHLVLPGNLAGSRHIIRWIKGHLGIGTFISLMSQYCPLYKAASYPILNRKIWYDEYNDLVTFLSENDFENVFIQELESAPLFVPDFEYAEPFKR
ncbi:MAG: radical SAM protein [Proteobacteria bacterium]|nr:radical SAM protein [Pseudomonadota bacterium]